MSKFQSAKSPDQDKCLRASSTFSTTPEGAPVKDENPRPDRLEQALDERALEHTPGFFFGGDEIHPDDVADTREFITQARAALADGLAVFYDCWW